MRWMRAVYPGIGFIWMMTDANKLAMMRTRAQLFNKYILFRGEQLFKMNKDKLDCKEVRNMFRWNIE